MSLALLLAVFIAVHNWIERECARCQAKVRQQYELLLQAEREKVHAQEKKWQALIREVERENQDRLQEMEAKYRGAAERIGVVRLCKPADRGGARVSRDTPASTVDHGAAGNNGLSGGAGGRDIGPGLTRISKAAETQTARLIACQSYVRTLEASH